jgi:hypothetical protein
LERLTAPLAPSDRAKFISAVDAAPPLPVLPGNPNDTLEEWAISVHLPHVALQYLESLGLDEVIDLWEMNDDDIKHMRDGNTAPAVVQDLERFDGFDEEGAPIEKESATMAASQEGGFVLGTGTSFGPDAARKGLKIVPIKRLVLATNAFRLTKPFDQEEEARNKIFEMDKNRFRMDGSEKTWDEMQEGEGAEQHVKELSTAHLKHERYPEEF